MTMRPGVGCSQRYPMQTRMASIESSEWPLSTCASISALRGIIDEPGSCGCVLTQLQFPKLHCWTPYKANIQAKNWKIHFKHKLKMRNILNQGT